MAIDATMAELRKNWRALHLKSRAKVVLVAFLAGCPAFGQSAGQPVTFRIEGTISSPWDSFPQGYLVPRKMIRFRGDQTSGNSRVNDKDVDVPIPRTEITFHGARTTRSVSVDEKGAYQVDLPLGVYEMTVRGPQIGAVAVTEYRRLFRVRSAATIRLNGTLYFARTNCDAVVPGDSESERLDAWKNVCGGEDFFPYPSNEGAPLQLYVRYSERKVIEHGYIYNSERRHSQTYIPVFVAYNLFSLEAQEVVYDEKASTIQANGSVVVTDATGTPHRADSISFIIRDGEAIQLPFNPNPQGGFLQPLGLTGYSTPMFRAIMILHEVGHAADLHGYPSFVENHDGNSTQSMLNSRMVGNGDGSRAEISGIVSTLDYCTFIARVGGAKLEFRDPRGTTVTAMANDVGEYTVSLKPGYNYGITVTSKGFCSVHRPPFQANSDSSLRFDFTLTLNCPRDILAVGPDAEFSSPLPVYFEETIHIGEDNNRTLIIAFGKRERENNTIKYASLPVKGHAEVQAPVTISMSTYTVQSDRAVLDQDCKTLKAEGKVSIADGSSSPPQAVSCAEIQLDSTEPQVRPCQLERAVHEPSHN